MMTVILYAVLILLVSCLTAAAIARIDEWCSIPFSESECPSIVMPVREEWEAFLELCDEEPVAN